MSGKRAKSEQKVCENAPDGVEVRVLVPGAALTAGSRCIQVEPREELAAEKARAVGRNGRKKLHP